MRWGLIPSWWNKTAKETPATFNAQSDTVATKPMFSDTFKKRRCLILMSGYCEWINAPDGKQPFYFCAKDGELLTAAGLWDEWLDPVNGARLWREGEPNGTVATYWSVQPRTNRDSRKGDVASMGSHRLHR